jgi:hypothetical protein
VTRAEDITDEQLEAFYDSLSASGMLQVRLAYKTALATVVDKRADAFKKYVHERLDEMGAPSDIKDNDHSVAGCRVGARLDWVDGMLESASAEKNALDDLIDAIQIYMRTEDLEEGRAAEALIRAKIKKYRPV